MDADETERLLRHFIAQVNLKYQRDKARGMPMDSISYYLGDLTYWLRNYVYSSEREDK